MTLDETKALIEMLRRNGVASYKTRELKLNFHTTNLVPAEYIKPAQEVETAPLTPEKEQEIKHTIEEMTSILKSSDDELINRLFPDTVPEEDGAQN